MTSRVNLRRLPLAPEEGWLSVALVTVMAVSAAWAIDDAGWVLGRSDWTDFLVWAAVAGVAVGFVGAKVGWGRWISHGIGATLAALIVPIIVGGVIPVVVGGVEVADPNLAQRFQATAAAGVNAWADLIVNQQPATRQTGHYLLVLGLLVWATGMFAAAAVFRHRRPLSAVVVIGAILIGNMAATVRDQLGYLIIFSLASLFLLTRLHAQDEQSTWLRRRIGDPASVGAIYLRGGTVFILIAVLGALTLTATARSAPLRDAWDDLKPLLLDVSSAIQRFLPAGANSRGIGAIQFGPNATIQGIWSTNEEVAMTIQRPPGDLTNYYWRAAAYDHFNLFGWDWSDGPRIERPAGDDLLADTADALAAERGSEVLFTVTPAAHRGYIVSPLAPVTIDRDAALLSLGVDLYFKAVEVDGNDPYVLKARVPIFGDVPGGITQNLLRVAGQDYPAEIKARYLVQTPGALGPEARALLADIVARSPAGNPFDIAQTMVREFHSSRFTYDTNVLDVDCGERSKAECFAWSKQGYCQQYATLMTVLLREHGIPARFVQGYLPGDLDPRTGVELVRNTRAHAWVEAWFPGHGWVMFDPTGGSVSEAEPLPSGRVVASASPNASPSLASRDPALDGPDPRRTGRPGAGILGGDGGSGAGPFIVISMLLLGVAVLVAFLAWRRGPRGPTTPEGVYAGVGRLAARFGFGPRPTQTAYEYAASLGDILPNARPELQTVAAAKVEVAYGRRTLGAERIAALRESYRRLRVAMLRLFIRRFRRRR